MNSMLCLNHHSDYLSVILCISFFPVAESFQYLITCYPWMTNHPLLLQCPGNTKQKTIKQIWSSTCRPCWKLRRIKSWCMKWLCRSCTSVFPNQRVCLSLSKTSRNTASNFDKAWASWKLLTASTSDTSAEYHGFPAWPSAVRPAKYLGEIHIFQFNVWHSENKQIPVIVEALAYSCVTS